MVNKKSKPKPRKVSREVKEFEKTKQLLIPGLMQIFLTHILAEENTKKDEEVNKDTEVQAKGKAKQQDGTRNTAEDVSDEDEAANSMEE